MKSKTSLLVLLLVCLISGVQAQSKTFENIGLIKSWHSGVIKEGDAVAGYYHFSRLVKQKKKSDAFRILIQDADLTTVVDKTIEPEDNLYLFEVAYNGEQYCANFFNRTKRQLELHFFNALAEEVAVVPLELNANEKFIMTRRYQSGLGDFPTLFPVANKGFIIIKYSEHGAKLGYSIQYFPSKAPSDGWKLLSDADSDKVEHAVFVTANEGHAVFNIQTKRTLAGPLAAQNLMAVNLRSGEILYRVPLKNETYDFYLMHAELEGTTGKLTFISNYAKITDHLYDAEMEGFSQVVVEPSGAFSEITLVSLKEKVQPLLPENTVIDPTKNLYFHQFIPKSNGNYYAIAELYTTGTRLNNHPVRIANILFKFQDLLVCEFNSDFELAGIEVVNKGVNVVSLMQNANYFGVRFMAEQGNMRRGDGYRFSNGDPVALSLTFLDEKHTKKEYIWELNTVEWLDDEAQYSKQVITTTGKNVKLMPAKEGFVMLVDYIRPEKRIETRLVKVDAM